MPDVCTKLRAFSLPEADIAVHSSLALRPLLYQQVWCHQAVHTLQLFLQALEWVVRESDQIQMAERWLQQREEIVRMMSAEELDQVDRQ
jgi:hypothetical protein